MILYPELEFDDVEIDRLNEICEKTGKTISQVLRDRENERREVA